VPGIRQDIHKLGPGWNATLLWYARAVRAMSQRLPTDRTSWAYLAAIHGFDRAGWIGRGIITNATALPGAGEQQRTWNQCQHAGWYFVPWHRGYLAAFEAIVAKTIADLGGPTDWALPYWNYLDANNPQARDLPQPFTDPTLPDGSANPLSTPPRGGTQILGPTPWLPRDINLQAMNVSRYTAATGTSGFGGGQTGFAHFGNLTGALEGNPHNLVHVMIGGVGVPPGFMSDPDYAGLDPVFWVHHCNIDRLWAAWLTQAGNVQEKGAQWMNGPMPQHFEMPDAGGQLASFTPADVLPGGTLAPTYDDLFDGTGIPPVVVAGGPAMPANAPSGPPPSGSPPSGPPPAATPIGSNSGAVTIATAATTTVDLAPTETITAAALAPEHLYLNLENVRGAAPSGVLNVFVGLPASGTTPAAAPQLVDTVTLFGLAKASATTGQHGGNGLTFAIDITSLAKSLSQQAQTNLTTLQVRIEQPGGANLEPITVERVSVFRQPG
jgi:tyrosinase